MALQQKQASFNGSQDYVDVTWDSMAGDFGLVEAVTITDGQGPILVWYTGRSATGARVNVSARFVGLVDLVIYDR